jgi:hypothetical protein
MIAKWEEHPDRDPAWATEERGRIGEERFRREHECEFVIYDETLIDALKLLEMKGVEPNLKMGQTRWYKQPDPDSIFVVALDPSSGTGGDNAAIQVLELSTMTQVAEWCHNKTPIEGQMKAMLDILMYLKECKCDQLYWSVENNAIGEAALVVIRDTGEETFPGDFLHEPKRIQGKKGRKGFHTTHKSKIEGCLFLKRLVEQDKIRIKSKMLVSELKNFVSRANSFAAKPGEFDDLVMSLVIAVRMIQYIGTFEEGVYDQVNSGLGADGLYEDDWDDSDGPMPIGII